MFAHDRLLPIFPNLPDAQKQSDASTAKLNQCVALLLLQLDPWLCVPHTGRAARKGHRQQQQQQQQLCTGISQGAEAAVDHLVYTAVRLGQALLLQSQGGDRGNPTHGDCRMMKQGSDGTPLLLSVQRLMEYAVHVLGAVGGSTKGSRKGKKGRSEDTTASELSTALQVALKLISQVRMNPFLRALVDSVVTGCYCCHISLHCTMSSSSQCSLAGWRHGPERRGSIAVCIV